MTNHPDASDWTRRHTPKSWCVLRDLASALGIRPTKARLHFAAAGFPGRLKATSWTRPDGSRMGRHAWTFPPAVLTILTLSRQPLTPSTAQQIRTAWHSLAAAARVDRAYQATLSVHQLPAVQQALAMTDPRELAKARAAAKRAVRQGQEAPGQRRDSATEVSGTQGRRRRRRVTDTPPMPPAGEQNSPQ